METIVDRQGMGTDNGTLRAPLRLNNRSLLVEYFRIPFKIGSDPDPPHGPLSGCRRIGAADATGFVATLDADSQEGAIRREFRICDLRLFGSVVPTATAEAWLRETGEEWSRAEPITDPEGREVSWTWASAQGAVFLPFDPDELMLNFWSEAYQQMWKTPHSATISRLGKNLYYRLRPYSASALRIALRRLFSRLQSRAAFPRWPVEPALHDLYGFVLGAIEEAVGASVPWIAPWPDGHSWALVLTHDVELAGGLEAIESIASYEETLGYRSSWNLVGRRYEVDPATVEQLRDRGFEIGVHGLYHDGRDLESSETLRERLPEMRALAIEWGAVGFRSPATHRVWEWMPLLGFEYDSSYPDTDPYEPQPGGCCSWLPFFNGDLVELPLTLPQDHTLFVILRRRGAETWIDKAEFLRSRGGMALIDTHPDYLVEEASRTAYDAFLAHFADDETAWRALPREVAAWWRRRAESQLELSPDGRWYVAGPAADEARVQIGVVTHQPPLSAGFRLRG